MEPSQPYDCLLWLSFGGPEKPEDVMAFLRNVTRGRSIPEERLALVAEQYKLFGGTSQINEQNRRLIASVRAALEEINVDLPIYFGNRNWDPYVSDALSQIATDGHRSVLVFTTSAYGSYSACRQYREDLERANNLLQAPSELEIVKIRHYFDHPLFIEGLLSGIEETVQGGFTITSPDAAVIATAHSIPMEMANRALYVDQLASVRRELGSRLSSQHDKPIEVLEAYQSRSGAPSQPWLEPDVSDTLKDLAQRGVRQVLVVPIGFISDHQEVRYDLDTLAASTASSLGLSFFRSPTVSNAPQFTPMVIDLVEEYLYRREPKRIAGSAPQSWVCSAQCCLGES